MTARNGFEGIELALEKQPVAIFLDLKVPAIAGVEILDLIKQNKAIQQIPLFLISADDRPGNISRRGAVGFLRKPFEEKAITDVLEKVSQRLSKKIDDVLIVEDDLRYGQVLKDAFELSGTSVAVVESAELALERLEEREYDCFIIDLMLPGMNGFEFLKRLSSLSIKSQPAIIIHTAKDLSREELNTLEEHSDSVIAKGDEFLERLLDEASLFLYKLQERKMAQKALPELSEADAALKGKKVLVVDDDVRNIYSLISILEPFQLEFIKAGDGLSALEKLKDIDDVDLIIMDIMLPHIDGFEVIKRIRQQDRFSKTPVLVISAKSMPEDRKKSLEAGANDYMTKPVDVHRLMSLLRVWLS